MDAAVDLLILYQMYGCIRDAFGITPEVIHSSRKVSLRDKAMVLGGMSREGIKVIIKTLGRKFAARSFLKAVPVVGQAASASWGISWCARPVWPISKPATDWPGNGCWTNWMPGGRNREKHKQPMSDKGCTTVVLQRRRSMPMNLEPYEKELEKLNACIWDYAELKFQEVRSAGAMEDLLEQHGFRVTRGLAHMPTAFVAEYGSGKPVIAILGEYDALSGLSQEDGVWEESPGKRIPTATAAATACWALPLWAPGSC